MSLARFSFVAGLVVSLFAVGCGDSDVDGTGADNSKVTLAGSIGSGSTSTQAFQAFGEVSTNNASLHVTARELHTRGRVGRKTDVAVGADGSFKVDVSRGARWVITVDDENDNSALVTFGNGQSAIAVSATGSGQVGDGQGSATVNVGNVVVVGGEARTDVVIDGKYGLASVAAAVDEVFEAANGAIMAAQEAVAAARQAAEAARDAADAARDAAEAARRAAEAARQAAGRP